MKREELKSIFDQLRFDPAHHLGLGDIRLTVAQQDEILNMIPESLPPAKGAVPDDPREQNKRMRKWFKERTKLEDALLSEHMELIDAMIKDVKKEQQPTAEGAEEILSGQIRQLKQFHTAFNLPQRDIPTIIPPEEFKLRHKILVEEVGELSDAYFVGDIVEVADAITDCLYVLIGTALQFGIANKLEACFNEVHRSNMSKLGGDGYPIMREDGKVMKGENYSRPDLKIILESPVATLHAQRLADKMVSERLRGAVKSVQEELLKHLFLMRHTNGYPCEAVPKATILELDKLVTLRSTCHD